MMKKKVLGLLLGIACFVPFISNASYGIVKGTLDPKSDNFACERIDDTHNKCTVKVFTTDALDNFQVKLAPKGGAKITEVKELGDFTFSTVPDTSANPIVVSLSNIEAVKSESIDLFTFTYEISGTEDCSVVVSLGESTVTVKENPTDDPEEVKETGSVIPYVAIAIIGLGAVALYNSNKNKAKMFNI